MATRFPPRHSSRCCALASLVILVLPALLAASDMSPETTERVKRATVQVWLGEAVQGSADAKWLGSGSGSFINKTGMLVTNNHVVDIGHGKSPAEKFALRNQLSLLQYKIVMNGGSDQEKSYKARVLYQNESADLALVQAVDESDKPLATPDFLRLVPSKSLTKGTTIWCFGFPGGDKASTSKDRHAAVTISRGNIIGLPRTPGGRIPRIDTDVKAAPGNSGGPQVNAEGDMVGVLSQGTVSNDTGDGILVRIIPAGLVADMVKVASARNKLGQHTDLEPFEDLFAKKESLEKPRLAKRLAIDDSGLIKIADMLDAGELSNARTAIDAKLEKSVLRDYPEPVQDQVRALDAQCILLEGRYDDAESAFKRLRRASIDNVRWFAASRAYILKEHNGEELRDPQVFEGIAADVAAKSVKKARSVVKAYQMAMPSKHTDWRNLTRELEDHQESLLVADSLAPGKAENDVFRIWRFQQDLNSHEYIRLFEDLEAWRRKREDFKAHNPKDARDKVRSLNTRLERLQEQLRDVERAADDLQKKMNDGGFRLDDPFAAEILN